MVDYVWLPVLLSSGLLLFFHYSLSITLNSCENEYKSSCHPRIFPLNRPISNTNLVWDKPLNDDFYYSILLNKKCGVTKRKKIHVFTVLTILTLQFMFLMPLRQNPVTAIHRVPKRKNTQLIILLRDLRIQWHFFSPKKEEKKKFKLLCFRIAPCDTYYFETMNSAIWRSSSIGVCVHH